MTEDHGYIVDLTIEEAIDILNPIFFNPTIARGCGKTRLLYNYQKAWTKIIESLNKEKRNGD